VDTVPLGGTCSSPRGGATEEGLRASTVSWNWPSRGARPSGHTRALSRDCTPPIPHVLAGNSDADLEEEWKGHRVGVGYQEGQFIFLFSPAHNVGPSI